MADTQSPQEGTSLAPSDVRALLAEISRISNDYDLRERIKEYDNALADSFIWRDCMEEADRLTTAARQPEAMADQSTEARLREALTKQMDEQDEDLPSSVARQRGLVWLHGWFNLSALSLPVQDTSNELTRLRAEVEAKDSLHHRVTQVWEAMRAKAFALDQDADEQRDGTKKMQGATLAAACNELFAVLSSARTTLNGEQANG